MKECQDYKSSHLIKEICEVQSLVHAEWRRFLDLILQNDSLFIQVLPNVVGGRTPRSCSAHAESTPTVFHCHTLRTCTEALWIRRLSIRCLLNSRMNEAKCTTMKRQEALALSTSSLPFRTQKGTIRSLSCEGYLTFRIIQLPFRGSVKLGRRKDELSSGNGQYFNRLRGKLGTCLIYKGQRNWFTVQCRYTFFRGSLCGRPNESAQWAIASVQSCILSFWNSVIFIFRIHKWSCLKWSRDSCWIGGGSLSESFQGNAVRLALYSVRPAAKRWCSWLRSSAAKPRSLWPLRPKLQRTNGSRMLEKKQGTKNQLLRHLSSWTTSEFYILVSAVYLLKLTAGKHTWL
jgi:hypothetical protein